MAGNLDDRDEEDTLAGATPIRSTLTVAVIVIAVFALIVVGVSLFTKRGVERQLFTNEDDMEDLRAVTGKLRPSTGFTPAVDVQGPWAVDSEIYVPVYSSIYVGGGAVHSNLATTLSVRNTSRTSPIIVHYVHYFDTNGELVTENLNEPHSLGPMATVDFFVDAADLRGGTGANFVVRWTADQDVSEPIVEAVMIGSVGAKGISFISRGTTVRTAAPDTAPVTQ